MFKLIIQDDEGKTTVVPLIRDEITIGRKEGNTIRLTERNVSRKHARIVKSNGAVVVEDLDSYNGVKVNGTRIQGRVAVSEADRILLMLKEVEGLSLKELEKVYNVNENALKVRLFRARQRVLKAFGASEKKEGTG